MYMQERMGIKEAERMTAERSAHQTVHNSLTKQKIEA